MTNAEGRRMVASHGDPTSFGKPDLPLHKIGISCDQENRDVPVTVADAEHCLTMAVTAMDHDSRAIEREMAAEWLKLSGAVLRPLKRMMT